MSFKMLLFVTFVIVTQLAQTYSFSTTPSDHEFKSLQTVHNEPKKQYNSSQLYVFGGADENIKILDTASKLDSTNGKWEAINSIPTMETQFCGAVVDKQIYLFGGFKDFEKQTKSEAANAYDCLTDTYTMLRSMPETREGCGAAALNGAIYVSGGATGVENVTPLSSVLRYDIRTDQWSTVRPMINTRRSHQLVEMGGLLYAIGSSANATSVEVYNATTDQWSFVSSTRYVYTWLGATAHEGKLYVLSTNGFESYLPSTNLWTTLNPPNNHAYWARPLVSMNGKLWTVGGEYTEGGKRTISKSVFTYDTSTAHWVKQRDMDAYRTVPTAFVVNH